MVYFRYSILFLPEVYHDKNNYQIMRILWKASHQNRNAKQPAKILDLQSILFSEISTQQGKFPPLMGEKSLSRTKGNTGMCYMWKIYYTIFDAKKYRYGLDLFSQMQRRLQTAWWWWETTHRRLCKLSNMWQRILSSTSIYKTESAILFTRMFQYLASAQTNRQGLPILWKRIQNTTKSRKQEILFSGVRSQFEDKTPHWSNSQRKTGHSKFCWIFNRLRTVEPNGKPYWSRLGA